MARLNPGPAQQVGNGADRIMRALIASRHRARWVVCLRGRLTAADLRSRLKRILTINGKYIKSEP